MKLAIDLDDVVLEFTRSVLASIRIEYGIDIPYDDITDWSDNPLKELRIFAEGGDWWSWLKSRSWLWSKCPAVEGAIGGIQQLRDAGHHIEVITAREPWSEYLALSWLGKWRPAVQQVTIVPIDGSKVESSNADLLVDDGPHNLLPWFRNGRSVIRYERPWNTSMPRKVPVAKNWADVVRMIGEIA